LSKYTLSLLGDAKSERFHTSITAAAFQKQQCIQAIQQAAVHPLQGCGQPIPIGARATTLIMMTPQAMKPQRGQQRENRDNEGFAGEPTGKNGDAIPRANKQSTMPSVKVCCQKSQPFQRNSARFQGSSRRW